MPSLFSCRGHKFTHQTTWAGDDTREHSRCRKQHRRGWGGETGWSADWEADFPKAKRIWDIMLRVWVFIPNTTRNSRFDLGINNLTVLNNPFSQLLVFTKPPFKKTFSFNFSSYSEAAPSLRMFKMAFHAYWEWLSLSWKYIVVSDMKYYFLLK